MNTSLFEEQMQRIVTEFRVYNGEEYINHIGCELARAGVKVDKEDFEAVITDILEKCDRRPRVKDFLNSIKFVNQVYNEAKNIEKIFGFRNFLDFCGWSNRRRYEYDKDELPILVLSKSQYEQEKKEFMAKCFEHMEEVGLPMNTVEDFFLYCFSRGFDVEESLRRLYRADEENERR